MIDETKYPILQKAQKEFDVYLELSLFLKENNKLFQRAEKIQPGTS